MMLLKTCTRCDLALPVSSFSAEPRTKSGYTAACTPCHTAAKRQTRSLRIATNTYIKRSHKPCNGCKEVLPMTSFYKEKHMVDGHAATCRWCKKLAIVYKVA